MRQLFEQALGQLQPDPAPNAYDRVRANLHGYPIWVRFVTTRRGNRTGLSAEFSASLHGRPICIWVHPRSTIFSAAPPWVPTGDDAFEAEWIVNGFPREVVAAVLDAPTRGALATHEPNSWMDVQAGALRVRHSLSRQRRPTPQQIVMWASLVQNMAARAVATFDQARASIAASQGEPAAAAWSASFEAQDLALRQARNEANRRFLWMLGIFVGGLLLVIFIALIVMIVSMF